MSGTQVRENQIAPPEELESIDGRVVEVTRRPTGEFVALLDNEQTWIQRENNKQARLRSGDKVTIRKGALGSYLLTTPSGVATRVRRSK